jgi:hypothetical protein
VISIKSYCEINRYEKGSLLSNYRQCRLSEEWLSGQFLLSDAFGWIRVEVGQGFDM